MTNTKFTQLEKQILRNYLPHQCAFDFGQCPMKVQELGNEIWKTENEDVSNSTIKGVVGSLVKKGVLECDTNEGSPRIWLDDVFRDNQDLLDEVIKLTA